MAPRGDEAGGDTGRGAVDRATGTRCWCRSRSRSAARRASRWRRHGRCRRRRVRPLRRLRPSTSSARRRSCRGVTRSAGSRRTRSAPSRPSTARSARWCVSVLIRMRSAPCSIAPAADPSHDADLHGVGGLAGRRHEPADVLAGVRVDDDADRCRTRSRAARPSTSQRSASDQAPGRATMSRIACSMSCGRRAGSAASSDRAERHRRERCGDAPDRGIEVVEGLLLDLRGDLGAEPAEAHRFVDDDDAVGLLTDSTIVSVSSGCSVRGSITSTSMPSAASFSAASNASLTMRPQATTVTSLPSRSDVGRRRAGSSTALRGPRPACRAAACA